MPHSDFPYMDEATRIMFRDQTSTQGMSRDSTLAVLTTGCAALQRLVADPLFYFQMETLAQTQAQHRDDYRTITESVSHFVGGFLMVERRVLEHAGLSPALINFLLQDAEALRTFLLDATIDPEAILTHLHLLQKWACNAADQLRESRVSAQKLQVSRRLAKHVTRGVGSALIIAINTSALAKIHMTEAGTAVSVAMGAALLEVVMDRIVPD